MSRLFFYLTTFISYIQYAFEFWMAPCEIPFSPFSHFRILTLQSSKYDGRHDGVVMFSTATYYCSNTGNNKKST